MSPDRLRPNEREALYAPDRRMRAYYYSFDPTGQPAIDAILSAAAHAGYGYHHTESWGDDDEWSQWGEGRSVVDVIQAAANEAALALLDAAEERDRLRSLADAAIRSDMEARQELDALLAERDALAAKIERVRALHQPVEVACWPCLASDCDHDDDEDCPTVNVPVCGHCLKVVEEATGRDDVLLSRWPCPTIRALDGGE